MCGIVGISSKYPIADRSLLVRMRDTMTHRGPDDAGLWWSPDGCLGLAHRRLSIIDLSPAGHQPMATEDGRFVLVYNGEVFNFREMRIELESLGHHFHSRTDS